MLNTCVQFITPTHNVVVHRWVEKIWILWTRCSDELISIHPHHLCSHHHHSCIVHYQLSQQFCGELHDRLKCPRGPIMNGFFFWPDALTHANPYQEWGFPSKETEQEELHVYFRVITETKNTYLHLFHISLIIFPHKSSVIIIIEEEIVYKHENWSTLLAGIPWQS